MSERTHAPRSGGRTAGEHKMGQGRDADTRRSDARGARHFTTGDDTRRSGIGRDGAGTPATRGGRGETDQPRVRVRDTEGVRAQRSTDSVRGTRRPTDPESAPDQGRRSAESRSTTRRPEPTLGKGRRPVSTLSTDRPTGSLAARDRPTGEVTRDRRPATGRATGEVAARARRAEAGSGRDRVTGDVPGRARKSAEVSGLGAGRDRKSGALAGRGSALGSGARERRPVVAAPVDGTAALDIGVSAAEPLRRTGEVLDGPRLRVAPPAPISAPRAPFVASVIGLVVVGVLGILVINTKTNENSFRIADLKQQDAALDNQQQDLANQLVEVSSIGNLDAAARRLGLVKAENPALIRLPDGKIIGVLTPANGRPAVTAQDAKTAGTGTDAGTSDTGAAGAGTGAAQGLPGDGTQGAAEQGNEAPGGTAPAGTGQ